MKWNVSVTPHPKMKDLSDMDLIMVPLLRDDFTSLNK